MHLDPPILRLLVVENQQQSATPISDQLDGAGFTIEQVSDNRTARQQFDWQRHDVVLLSLPASSAMSTSPPPTDEGDECSFNLARDIQSRSAAGVIVIGDRCTEPKRLQGLELGIDDYIQASVTPRELVARIRNLGRRVHHARRVGAESKSAPEHEQRWRQLGHGSWRLDGWSRRLHGSNGIEQPLTRGEYELLQVLMNHPGRVMNRQELLEQTGIVDLVNSDRAIDSMIRRLRRKLESDPQGGDPNQLIRTIYGVGYLFAADTKGDDH